MIYEIDKELYFDSKSLCIIKGDSNLKEYCKFESEEIIVKENKELPLLIFLSSTKCNLNCAYCYAEKGTYNMQDKNNMFEAKNYINYYEYLNKNMGPFRAISFFGGEPILNFHEIKIFVDYLYITYGIDNMPKLGINTNMTIMNDEIKNFLEKYSIDIGTSIDGDKNQHNLYRKSYDPNEDVYKLVNDNLERIEKIKSKKIAQLTLTGQHISDYKKNGIEYFLKNIEDKKITKYEIVPVETHNPEICIDLSDEESENDYRRFCKELAGYFLSKLAEEDTPIIPNLFISIVIAIMKKEYHRDCKAGYSITVTPKGKIYPCHMFANDYKLGINIDDCIFENKLIKDDFFEEVRSSKRNSILKCNNCISEKICGGWCKGFSFLNTGGFKSVSKARCIMYEVYVKEIIRYLGNRFNRNSKFINNIILLSYD